MTTGLHTYIGVDNIYKNQSAEGYITFVCPESYQNILKIGSIISFQMVHENGNVMKTKRERRQSSYGNF